MSVFIGLLCFPALATIIWYLSMRRKRAQLHLFSEDTFSAFLIFYAVVLFLLHLVRIGNNNYWGDEGYSIMLSRMNYVDMIAETATDVHPPLYYIILKLVCFAVGNNHIAYNLTSLIPYAIFLIVSVTVIRSNFGNECCAILVTFSALLNNTIVQNMEARMYSWGLFFVFWSYLMLYRILHEHNHWNYFWFTIASLCAAYTHYYCLLIVAFFYLALLVLVIVDNKKHLKPVLLTCAGTVVGYLPWLLALIRALAKTTNSFWIEQQFSLHKLVGYLFDGKLRYLFAAIWIIVIAVYFIKEINVISIVHRKNGKAGLRICLSNLLSSTEAFWIMSGLCSIVGTMVIGIVVSKLIRPLLLFRYIYPAAAIAWLTMGIGISKLKSKKFYALCIVFLILLSGCFQYQNTIANEKQEAQMLEETLLATSEISSEDQIFTTEDHINWTIARYYYPNVPCRFVDLQNMPALEQNKTYWLIVNTTKIDAAVQYFNEQALAFDEVIAEGHLGTHYVTIYKITL